MQFEWKLLAWCLFLIPFCCLYAAALMRLFRVPEAIYGKGFNMPLEGLRGLSSAMVLMSHTTMYFYATGLGAGSKTSSFAGQSGVIWFFMLTGFLFWSMVLNGKVDMSTFYQKRLRRLVPAMVCMVTVALGYEWWLAGFPRPSSAQLLNVLRNYFFYFAGVHDVFYPDIVLRINVLWTLRWEWLFYIVLPLTSVFARRWYALSIVLIVASLTFGGVIDGWRRETDAALFLAFYLGMSGAYLAKWQAGRQAEWVDYLSQGFFFLLMLALAVSSLIMPADLIRSRNIQFVLLMAPLFYWFLLLGLSRRSASSVFTTKPALQLGRISYSLYLWHLLVAYVVHRMFTTAALPGLDTLGMIIAMPIMVVVVAVPIAVLSYKYVELPFMSAARK